MGGLNNFQFSIFNFQRKDKSFTLIETIIVVGITGLIIPVVFAIIFVILQQQAKIIRLQEVKNQGDFVLSNIRTTIRNSAAQIYDTKTFTNEWCGTAPSSSPPDSQGDNFIFKDKSGNWFNYYLSSDKISSDSAQGRIDLTNQKVKVTSYTISCQRQSVYSPPIVSLSLTLQYNTTSTRPEEQAELTYNTNIKLKSY
jgi:type II secretory pathway pseudopilin PulG